MDNFNYIVSLVKESMPLVQSGIPALVGGLMTAMFLRGNTQRTEFEKIKAGKIKEALDDLVESRELTLTELVKCNNLLNIAKLADAEYAKRVSSEDKHENEGNVSFDWFMSFFESAGNVSNHDMQIWWAKILAGEMLSPNSIPLSLVHAISVIDSTSAKAFTKLCNYTWKIKHFEHERIIPLVWVLEGQDDIYYNEKGLTFRILNELDSHGLVKFDYQSGFSVASDNLILDYFDEIIYISSPTNEIRTGSVMLTYTGEALYQIIEKEKDDDYFNECIKFFASQQYRIHDSESFISNLSNVDFYKAILNQKCTKDYRCAYTFNINKSDCQRCYSNDILSTLREGEMSNKYRIFARNIARNFVMQNFLAEVENLCYNKECKKRKNIMNE